jgi:hypothetical protein
MTPEYLAGFFDGEGTFIIGKQKKNGVEYPHASVILSQSGEDGKALLEHIQFEYAGNLYQHLKIGQHKATKNAYKLYWNRVEAINLIRELLPHLILKQQAAKTVLEYLTRND